MRTKTNIFFGNGAQGFGQYLKSAYPAGVVAVVYDDRVLGEEVLSRIDPALYKARLLSHSELAKNPLPDSVRYLIAAGGERAADSVKKNAKDRGYCVYAQEIDYRYFSPCDVVTGQKYDFADFVYFDNSKLTIKDTKLVTETYFSAFDVLTECVMSSYYESNLPYTDKGLKGIAASLRKLLVDGCDIDKFFAESLRLIKQGVEYLNAKESYVFFSARALSVGRREKEYRFIIDYFLNSILINFTKWNFFDMLIPAEKLIPEIPSSKPNYRGEAQGILLSKEELSAISAKARNLTVLPKAEKKEVLKLIIDTVNGSTPLMAEINNRGILEGLLNYG